MESVAGRECWEMLPVFLMPVIPRKVTWEVTSKKKGLQTISVSP